MKFLNAFVCLIMMLALFTTTSATAVSTYQCIRLCQQRGDREKESCEKGCREVSDRFMRRGAPKINKN